MIQKCPICEGHGTVAGGFYQAVGGQTSWISNVSSEQCRTCTGQGVIRDLVPPVTRNKNLPNERLQYDLEQKIIEFATEARFAYFSCAPSKSKREHLDKAMRILANVLNQYDSLIRTK